MMTVVVKAYFGDEKTIRKAMKTVSGIQGMVSISIDPKNNKLTVTGVLDPIDVVVRLRKLCRADVESIAAVKEPEKEQTKEPVKEQTKEPVKVDPVQLLTAYQQQAYYQNPYYVYQQPPYFYRSAEEDRDACVIS